MTATKKKTVRARRLTGLAGAPIGKSFEDLKYYFHYEMDKKDIVKLIKTYARSSYNKSEYTAINANPDWKFAVVAHMAAAIYWMNLGNKFKEEKYKRFPEAISDYMERLVEDGKHIIQLTKTPEIAAETSVRLTPHQLMVLKANNTIMRELDFIEDSWLEGKEVASFDVYTKMVEFDLKGPTAVKMVKDWCQFYIDDYNDKEGYEHLKAAVIKKRIKLLKQIIDDVDRYASAQKTTRKTRVKKPKAADVTVKGLKYMTESVEHKLKSINPIVIIGAQRLYVYNTRNRELTEFVASGRAGLGVKGTSIINFDPELSRKVKLRKPDEFLPDVLKKTAKQINNSWEKLTTKSSTPNGRVGTDVVLVRVLNV